MVKYLLATLVVSGMARYCSKIDAYEMLDQHKGAIQLKTDSILMSDIQNGDSAAKTWANEFSANFDMDITAYHPDKKIIEKLKKKLQGMSVHVVGGNWCSDTRRELPKLVKVLHYCRFPADSFFYYRVDRDKNTQPGGSFPGWQKSSIPDIGFFKNGKDLGHIHEVTRKSMEADMLDILKSR